MSTLAADTQRAIRSWIPAGLTRGQMVTAAALVIIAASVGFRAWVSYGAWFYADDFIFLSDVARGDADLRWLLTPHDSQFMPLGLGLAWLVGASGTFAWPLAATEIVVMQALASVVCWLMLTTLFGKRPLSLVPLAWYTAATFTVPAVTWWAVSLNQLPLHIVFFGVVTAHVRYLRTKKLRFVVIAVALLTLGFLAYVKTLLVLPILALITVLYFTGGSAKTRVWDALRRFWPAWTAYAAIAAAYLVAYLAIVPSPVEYTTDVSYGDLLDALVYRSFATGVLGGPWTWDTVNPPLSLAAPASWQVTLSWVVLAALVALAAVRRRRSLGALSILTVYLAMSFILVANGRANHLGGFVGLEFRYLADVSLAVTLTLGLMLLPLRTTEGERHHEQAVGASPDQPATGLLAALAITFVVAGAIMSTVRYVGPWHENYPARQFTETASLQISENPDTRVADIPVDQNVLLATAWPYNLPSYFLAPAGVDEVVRTQGNELSAFSPSGELVRAEILDGLRSVPGPDAGCGYPVAPDAPPVTVPMTSRVVPFPWWMTINYLASDTGSVTVEAGDEEHRLPIRKGLSTLYVQTDGGYDSVRFADLKGVGGLCIDTVSVGTLTPAEPR